jgi:hypothetical protein
MRNASQVVIAVLMIALHVGSCQSAQALSHNRRLGPFVIGGLCTGYGGTNNSINYLSQNGQLVLQVNGVNQQSGNNPAASYSGWEVFNSQPAINPGNISPSATNVAPTGTYTFNLSGLPATNNFMIVTTVYSNGAFANVLSSVGNGQVSIIPGSSASLGSPVNVIFWIYNNATPITRYMVSHFAVNGIAIGIDTSHVDNHDGTGVFDWCGDF